MQYHDKGNYTVKAGRAEGYAARRRTSGNLLVAQCVDDIGAMFRADGSGGSAARDIARALSNSGVEQCTRLIEGSFCPRFKDPTKGSETCDENGEGSEEASD